VETPIGKVTGDGSTPTAMGCRAGYQSQGFPSRYKDNEVLTDRELAGSQDGVKHFVPQRNGPSPEAHRLYFHNG
jgi:hypothetical protein